MMRHACSCACALLFSFYRFDRAEAHPMVWSPFNSEVLRRRRHLTGVRHPGLFDDMVFRHALQALPSEKGQYTREELASPRPTPRGIAEEYG